MRRFEIGNETDGRNTRERRLHGVRREAGPGCLSITFERRSECMRCRVQKRYRSWLPLALLFLFVRLRRTNTGYQMLLNQRPGRLRSDSVQITTKFRNKLTALRNVVTSLCIPPLAGAAGDSLGMN